MENGFAGCGACPLPSPLQLPKKQGGGALAAEVTLAGFHAANPSRPRAPSGPGLGGHLHPPGHGPCRGTGIQAGLGATAMLRKGARAERGCDACWGQGLGCDFSHWFRRRDGPGASHCSSWGGSRGGGGALGAWSFGRQWASLHGHCSGWCPSPVGLWASSLLSWRRQLGDGEGRWHHGLGTCGHPCTGRDRDSDPASWPETRLGGGAAQP